MKNIINEKTDVMIKNKAKASGISASILRQVYSRGAAAWKSGHRPGVSQQQWAAGRLNSFLTGKGGARKADSDLWAKAKKSKKRKNESNEEILLRKKIREILNEEYFNNKELDELYPMLVGEDDLEEGLGKYVAGAALGLGLALGSPGKALAQQTAKDDVNKPKIVKTFQNLKKSIFDKKIEPEPEKVSKNKTDLSKPVRIDGGPNTYSIDSLIKQTGKVTNVGNGKYQTVTRQDFSESQKGAWNFIESDLRIRAQSMMRDYLKQNVPVEAMGWPETVVFRNPDGSYTMFAILNGSGK